MRTHALRTTLLASTAALALTLSACGGETDEGEGTTPVEVEGDSTADQGDATGEGDDGATSTDSVEGDDETDGSAAGEGDETADETDGGVAAGEAPDLAIVWPTVVENTRSLDALTADISVVQNGQTMEASLTGQMDDSNFQVEISMDGDSATVVADDGAYFVNGEAGFWEMVGAPDPSVLADQWVEAPEEAGLASEFSLSQLWSDFLREIPTETSWAQGVVGELSEFDGVEAYHYLVEQEGVEIWITADGEDNLIRATIDEGTEEPFEIKVSDWDDVEPVEAPTDARSFEELMAG